MQPEGAGSIQIVVSAGTLALVASGTPALVIAGAVGVTIVVAAGAYAWANRRSPRALPGDGRTLAVASPDVGPGGDECR